ncbi:IS3 family transposase [candidate division KSB1 bacterium]|nr:MAG: IS3 family transposase [candidate division KSB1 bacterium]
MPEVYRDLIKETVIKVKEESGFSIKKSLKILGIKTSTYYNWKDIKRMFNDENDYPRHPDTILPEEKERVIVYALAHPNLRHRELAWSMVDENVVCISPSSVYKILREADLVCRWKPKDKRKKGIREKPQGPDEKWQSDIVYIKYDGRNYYLINFMDEYSRYITYSEIMTSMDRNAVSYAADLAISRLDKDKKPVIQTDNGSGFISREFKIVLSKKGIGHHRIKPHCPEENRMIERVNGTIKDMFNEYEPESLDQVKEIINKIIHYYNNERLHSSINFLRPVDYYRGDPEKLLEERRVKLAIARHKRRKKNLKIKQKSIPLIKKEFIKNCNLLEMAKSPTPS